VTSGKCLPTTLNEELAGLDALISILAALTGVTPMPALSGTSSGV
jgi:hypothetical protein